MAHEYKQRAPTLEDLARDLVKGESLEVQLALSALVAKARHVATQQAANGGVIDFERGWRLT